MRRRLPSARGSRWVAAVVLWCLGGAKAEAARLTLVPAEGVLRAGVPGTVVAVLTDDAGRGVPFEGPPQVISGGALLAETDLPGELVALRVSPQLGAAELRVSVAVGGQPIVGAVAVAPHAPAGWVVSRRVDVLAGASEVVLRVAGADLPPPEALQVSVPEGQVLGVSQEEGALLVRLAPGGGQHPRVVPVLIRDARGSAPPVASAYRVWTRPRVALQTEPGVRMTVKVGGRSYGPVAADPDGVAAVVVDHYPGETAAEASLSDDFGNETSASLPLANQVQTYLTALVEGAWVPGRSPPLIWLRGLQSDGHAWTGGAPICQAAGVPELRGGVIEPGVWAVALPEAMAGKPTDTRLYCRLGASAETVVLVRVVDAYPSELKVRVYPEDPSTAFPLAEVQASLEDAGGARLPVERVHLSALRGEVSVESNVGTALRGEYRGQAALSAGYDVLVARYDRPTGDGAPRYLEIAHSKVDPDGIWVHGRVFDAQGGPLQDQEVELASGEARVRARTDARGWASARLPVPPGGEPIEIRAQVGRLHAALPVPRDAIGGPGPSAADLEARQTVRFLSGRVSNVQIEVTPPILYTGASAVAVVEVRLHDRGGTPLNGTIPEISASEGFVGAVEPLGEGRYRAEYTPPPGERARVVEIVARAEGEPSRTVQLVLEPRPLQRLAIGAGLGGLTNFAELGTFAAMLDADLDVPRLSEIFRTRIFLRLGVGWYGDEATAQGAGPSEEIRLSLNVIPLTAGLVARREQGGKSLWVGAGAVAAPHAVRTEFGTHALPLGFGVWPGISVLGGAGRRAGPGEVFGELRWTGLVASGGEVAWRGQVGGLTVLTGYRVLY